MARAVGGIVCLAAMGIAGLAYYYYVSTLLPKKKKKITSIEEEASKEDTNDVGRDLDNQTKLETTQDEHDLSNSAVHSIPNISKENEITHVDSSDTSRSVFPTAHSTPDVSQETPRSNDVEPDICKITPQVVINTTQDKSMSNEEDQNGQGATLVEVNDSAEETLTAVEDGIEIVNKGDIIHKEEERDILECPLGDHNGDINAECLSNDNLRGGVDSEVKQLDGDADEDYSSENISDATNQMILRYSDNLQEEGNNGIQSAISDSDNEIEEIVAVGSVTVESELVLIDEKDQTNKVKEIDDQKPKNELEQEEEISISTAVEVDQKLPNETDDSKAQEELPPQEELNLQHDETYTDIHQQLESEDLNAIDSTADSIQESNGEDISSRRDSKVITDASAEDSSEFRPLGSVGGGDEMTLEEKEGERVEVKRGKKRNRKRKKSARQQSNEKED